VPKNDDGEFELVLGNNQLLSVFFLVVLLLALCFIGGYTVGRNILCAYVDATEPVHSSYEVEVMGTRYPAARHMRPLYDPDRTAILA